MTPTAIKDNVELEHLADIAIRKVMKKLGTLRKSYDSIINDAILDSCKQCYYELDPERLEIVRLRVNKAFEGYK